MTSLVPWKKKVDLYREENDDDSLGTMEARLVDSIQEPNFIMRDEANAKAMKAMRMKKWW